MSLGPLSTNYQIILNLQQVSLPAYHGMARELFFSVAAKFRFIGVLEISIMGRPDSCD
jgi:hypothetical protein